MDEESEDLVINFVGYDLVSEAAEAAGEAIDELADTAQGDSDIIGAAFEDIEAAAESMSEAIVASNGNAIVSLDQLAGSTNADASAIVVAYQQMADAAIQSALEQRAAMASLAGGQESGIVPVSGGGNVEEIEAEWRELPAELQAVSTQLPMLTSGLVDAQDEAAATTTEFYDLGEEMAAQSTGVAGMAEAFAAADGLISASEDEVAASFADVAGVVDASVESENISLDDAAAHFGVSAAEAAAWAGVTDAAGATVVGINEEVAASNQAVADSDAEVVAANTAASASFMEMAAANAAAVAEMDAADAGGGADGGDGGGMGGMMRFLQPNDPFQAMILGAVALLAAIAPLTVAMTGFTAGMAATVGLMGAAGLGMGAIAAGMLVLAYNTGQDAAQFANLQNAAKQMADTLGKEVAPYAAEILVWAQGMLPLVQQLGSFLIQTFGPWLPDVLAQASVYIQIVANAIGRLAEVFSGLVGYVLGNGGNFISFFQQMADFGVGAVTGLVNNLERLSGWFFNNLPGLEGAANATFGALGRLVQGIAQEVGKLYGELQNSGALQDFESALNKMMSSGMGGGMTFLLSVFNNLFIAVTLAGGGIMNLLDRLGGSTAFQNLASQVDQLIIALEGGPWGPVGNAILAIVGHFETLGTTIAGAMTAIADSSQFQGLVTAVANLVTDFTKGEGAANGLVKPITSVVEEAMKLATYVVNIADAFVKWAGAKNVVEGIVIAITAWRLAQMAVNTYTAITTGLMAAQAVVAGEMSIAEAAMAAGGFLAAAAEMAMLWPLALIALAIAAVIVVVILIVTHWTQVHAVLTDVWNLMKQVGSWIGSTFVAAWNAVSGAVSRFVSTVIGDIGGFFSRLGTMLNSGWQAFSSDPVYWIGYAIGFIIGSLATLLSNVTTWATNLAKQGLDAASNFFVNVTQWFQQLPGRVWSFLTTVISDIITWDAQTTSWALHAGQTFLNNVIAFLIQLPGNVWSFLSNAIGSAISFAENFPGWASSAGSSFVSNIINELINLPGQVMTIGYNIVTGIWNGIQGMAGWLRSQVASFASGIVSGLAASLGIHSPSAVMAARIGIPVAQGIAQGIDQGTATVNTSVQHLVTGSVQAANGVAVNINGNSSQQATLKNLEQLLTTISTTLKTMEQNEQNGQANGQPMTTTSSSALTQQLATALYTLMQTGSMNRTSLGLKLAKGQA